MTLVASARVSEPLASPSCRPSAQPLPQPTDSQLVCPLLPPGEVYVVLAPAANHAGKQRLYLWAGEGSPKVCAAAAATAAAGGDGQRGAASGLLRPIALLTQRPKQRLTCPLVMPSSRGTALHPAAGARRSKASACAPTTAPNRRCLCPAAGGAHRCCQARR